MAGIPLVLAFLYFNQPIWAAALFFVLSLTDALDGYLARRLKMMSDFGKLMDPAADKLLVISVLILLVEKGISPSLPVIIIAARELFIGGWRAEKGAKGVVVGASITGKIKTVIQVIAVLMLMLNLPYAFCALWIAALVSIYSGVEYVGRG